MNDDQVPEGVEISDYIGPSSSPRPNLHNINHGKAEDASGGFLAQHGSRAITRWAIVGLVCTLVSPLLFLSMAVGRLFAILGITFQNHPFLSYLALYFPLASIAAGLVIGIVTLLMKGRASNPDIVGRVSRINIAVATLLILYAALLIYGLSQMDLPGEK
jgi:hypothetical protein